MIKSFRLFLIVFCISIISSAIEPTTETTDTSKTTDSFPRRCHPEIDGIVIKSASVYVWAIFTILLCFLTLFLIVLWIKDTVRLTNTIKELEKKVQDMEQYGVMKPGFTPQYVKTPPKLGDKKKEKKDVVKIVNEVTAPTSKSKTPTEDTKTGEEKARKSFEKPKKVPQTPIVPEKTEETKSTTSKTSTVTSNTAEGTTEESKTSEATTTRTFEKELEEPSPAYSIATAELQLTSRKRY